jgi:hypothetical protein
MELTNLGDTVPSEHGHRSRCRCRSGGPESGEFCSGNGQLPSFLEVARIFQFLPGSGPRECKIYRLIAPIS